MSPTKEGTYNRLVRSAGGEGGEGGVSGPVHERKTEEMQGHGTEKKIKKIVFPNHENKHVHTLNNLLLH